MHGALVIFRQLYDRSTCTFSYLLADPGTREAVLIDPVAELLERDATLIEQLDLTLRYTLETHIHADHVTSSGALRQRLGSRVVVSAAAGAQGADVEVRHGDTVTFGRRALGVRATPGHTSTCITYVTDDERMAFTGDALFVRGCGRTDFQDGSSDQLYDSVWEQILSLPDDTLLYPGHDYRGNTVTSVGEEKRHNPRLGGGRTKEQFAAIMAGLDLAEPARIKIAVPANLRCGQSG